jgi:hypothetical protein
MTCSSRTTCHVKDPQPRKRTLRHSGSWRTYLMRKQVRVMPAVPAYVLVVIPRYRWYEWREDANNEVLAERLSQEMPLPSNTYILVLGSQVKRQWKKKALKYIPPLGVCELCHPSPSRAQLHRSSYRRCREIGSSEYAVSRANWGFPRHHAVPIDSPLHRHLAHPRHHPSPVAVG